jgi:four helix bundle protein
MPNITIRELAIELTVEITQICDNIKGRSVFVNQILKSCSSIGANSAEAKYAQSTADFIHKLEISLKECYETEFWLSLFVKSDILTQEEYNTLKNDCGKIRRLLISSVDTAKKNAAK